MDYWSVAVQKLWEGFWYTLGAGIALGLIVGIAVQWIKRVIHYGHKKITNGWLKNVLDTVKEAIE